MSDDVEKVAAGLTGPQREAVLALSETPQRARRLRFSAQAAFNVVHKGIVGIGFDRALLCDTYYLTPLGLAVRQHILEQSK